MHVTHSHHAASGKTTKIAAVVAFHVLLGLAMVKSMNMKTLSLPRPTPPIDLVPARPADPPPAVDPPPVATLPVPRLVVPVPEVPVSAPPTPDTVSTTTVREEARDPAPAATPKRAPGGTGTSSAGPALRKAVMAAGCITPAYPARAARNGDTGTVTLALLVGVDGKVSTARVERSSGHRDLDQAALNALSQCAFRPAMNGDVAEAAWALIAYDWNLE